ncbi:twin-arginine translocase subunit TatC [Streptomyces sp. NPDC002812]|uniref:twin-arginine translocase subunit TatC n=1 Tax=unclassified Streptomyces TaxID=2593676 RepID=UPI002030F020|nr:MULTISPECIES: twin-arginine translocase subunit TatC [unclassified Streptomyces]MCM1970573.1 twin-arginine translocase subunit TatC [Streptomyces sp. G1]MCX5130382.1 twin-arginine translocase subunit TatC [Streptomyces sp. NBC_00347]MCX5301763.1 twin-arginine translocase subunit TatC [Streptomyces sp. NBC_00193]
MPLADHLRELRNRLAKALLAVVVVAAAAGFGYTGIIDLVTAPILGAVGCDPGLAEAVRDPDVPCARIVMNGLLIPFTLALKVSLVAGVVLASPVWLYQLWAFIAPGLHRQEKKYALLFAGAGFPLFATGAYVAYRTLPTMARVLLDFTPADVDNQLPLDSLLDLITRMAVVFGLAFELPLLLVMLNLTGMVSGRRMLTWWRHMFVGITLFAAIATPSTDPLSMLALAVPVWMLYLAATAVSLLLDRRRAEAPAGPGDDEASVLDPA